MDSIEKCAEGELMTKEKIKAFIVDHFLFGERGLEDDEPLFESGIIDSLGLIKLLAFIEETFNVSLNMSEIDIEDFNTLDDILKTIKRKMDQSCS
jgi:acyl carrier protein